ncbi:MAG: DUF2996 domain-containing protein [Brasilonema angustatum HA4187-MV1]|jgi:hypothetical protein|nr:DUF2996 domain-containing protein [Brasilonema angustatum HA4187-MV1]
MAEETNHNEAGEVAPSTVDKQAPSVAEEHAPSTDSPEATDIPSANAPEPASANSEANPNAGKTTSAAPKREKPAEPAKAEAEDKPPAKAEAGDKPAKGEAKDKPAKGEAKDKPAEAAEAGDKPAKEAGDKPAKGEAGEKPAAKAKKEKAPAVEDKPFGEFIQQDYLPAVQKAIAKEGVQDLALNFAKQKISIVGFDKSEECWQIIGTWQNGSRQFNLYFTQEDIQGKKAFSCNEGKKPSTLESFLIDERKVTLDLLVYGLMQRLNGQKWLGRN